MFILIVSRGYPTERYPGNGIFEFDQARALAETGHKVIYAAIDLRSIRRWRKWWGEHFIKDGVEIYAVNIPLGRMPHSVLCHFGMLGLSSLYRIIQREHGNPDIIHAHFLNMAEIALCLKSKSSAKFVMTEHSSMFNGDYSTLPRWVKTKAFNIYNQYDEIVCVSYMLSDVLKKFFNIKSVVISNIASSIFMSKIHDLDLHENFEFVFVGRIVDGKSPLECIQAFYDAFQKEGFTTEDGRKIILRIIGDGPLFVECNNLIQKLNIKDNVKMMGQLTRDKIADILASSDCFVLPSKLETFGVVYIEAMACGLPVIATRCGGPESFVKHDNGILIPVGDPISLRKALQFMCKNIEKYDKNKIAAETKESFAPSSIAKRLMAIYKQ